MKFIYSKNFFLGRGSLCEATTKICPNFVECSEREDLFSTDKKKINASIPNGRHFDDHLKLRSVNYCEMSGTFIFYSKENYQVRIYN